MITDFIHSITRVRPNYCNTQRYARDAERKKGVMTERLKQEREKKK